MWGFRSRVGRAAILAGLSFGVVAPAPAAAQALLPPGQTLVAPGPAGIGSPGMSLAAPGLPSAPPLAMPPTPSGPNAGQVALYLYARFGADKPQIPGNLIWRIFSDKPDANGAFKLLQEQKVAAPAFVLPAGGYIVHCSFGHASATKQITLRAETVREVVDIPAGGIRIEGRVGDVRIPQSQISFDIFKGSQFEPGDKRPLATGIMTGEVMLLPEGTYTIVSNYGDGNSVVRSDIRVRVGQLTDVTVTHRAAIITLKLLGSAGGEALANTSWSVLTPGGDVIKESIGAFPRVILAEGEYKAIARNEGKVFEHDFKVITGVDSEVAVIAR
ncbi:MAG: hypothetical protein HXY30_10190 [Pseudorhodoplanes sp.]|nr:hypothetical protein [Pseudorhodoplanes sp.]